MNKILLAVVIVGVALLIIGLVQIAIKGQAKLIGEKIVEDTVKFTNEDATILTFNATRDNYRLRIEIEPLKNVFGGIEVKPLVFAMLVDDEGLKNVLNNQSAYIYLTVEGLDEKKEFLIDDINTPKRFHILFSTPLPEQSAKVTITMVYKVTEPISPFEIGLSIAGISIIIGSIVLNRYKK